MEERRIDQVQITLRHGIVVIPWSSRDALLAQFQHLNSMRDVRKAFYGTTRPVELTEPARADLIRVIEHWDSQAPGGLPPGISELRNALYDDLHDVRSGCPEAELGCCRVLNDDGDHCRGQK